MNIAAIDLGGTRIKAGLIMKRNLVDLQILEAGSAEGLGAHLPLIDDCIQQFIQKNKLHGIDGIVMAFPGIVNPVTKKVISTSKKYEDAIEFNLALYYKNKWNTSFLLENDARLACLGEWKFGAAKGYNDIVMCTLGTGFGSSAVINGKILQGYHHQAGILGGHSIIDFTDSTHQCSCGGYGCVEAGASTWNMRRLATNHVDFANSKLSFSDKTDWRLIEQYRKEGDSLSQLLYDHCVNVWATGITNLIHAYDPQVIVIGGGIMHTGDELKSALEKMIRQKAWCPSGLPEFRVAKFTDSAALLGSITLFENNYE